MVGVNSCIYRFGTVAIFATLFAAIQVKGDRGCIFDSEHLSDFELECNEVKRSWTVEDEVKDSPKRKVLVLAPERDGCLKTKNTVTLNSTSPVAFRFYKEGTKDVNEKITLRLIPKEGSCPEEDCVWIITDDSQFKPGEWIDAQHKFPLKSMKDYYVQLQVDKNKGKLMVDRISLPNAFGNSTKYKTMEGEMTNTKKAGTNEAGSKGSGSKEAGSNEINLIGQLVAADVTEAPNTTSLSPGLAEISKNLMLTSASVLTLNNLLN